MTLPHVLPRPQTPRRRPVDDRPPYARPPRPPTLSVAALLAAPPSALAEVERPRQGETANSLVLSYAPKPDEGGAVCIVDSGIDENPDTEEAILERTSVAGDSGSGEDGDTDDRHGTSMAMVAGAPRNGWEWWEPGRSSSSSACGPRTGVRATFRSRAIGRELRGAVTSRRTTACRSRSSYSH